MNIESDNLVLNCINKKPTALLPISLRALCTILLCGVFITPLPASSQEPYFSAELVPVADLLWFLEYGTGVGDVDLDGDLDVYYSERLYLQDSRDPLAFEAVWYGNQNVQAAILADMDGDNDPDLVLGRSENSGSPDVSRIYLNESQQLPHVFLDEPWWQTRESRPTQATAVADLNGDGRLDVLCGNTWAGDDYRDTGYLNGPTGLPTTPSWFSSTGRATEAIAVGDLDGDADFDLICGVLASALDSRDMVYLNTGSESALDTLPHWNSGVGTDTRAVCLGDLDGDGDFDLVSGGYSGIQVFWNEFTEGNEAIFDSLPSWETQAVLFINDLELADLDRDGDLDLMCATDLAGRNTLLFNEGSAEFFTVGAEWPPQAITHNLQLADFNQDGYPDVNFTKQGNGSGIHLNRMGPLAKSAVHPLLVPATTNGIALGDMDNDGDLDLVVGNDGQSQLYWNSPEIFPESIFSPVPSWNNRFPVDTRDVALADIDGNGYLDLICGNYNESDHVYLNSSGTLSSDPGWISNAADFTVSLAAGDVDQDGYPDLVMGNLTASNRFYLNNGGGLPGAATWSSEAANDTRDVVLADVNGDGYLDLVCGNVGQSNTLYLFQPQEQIFTAEPVWRSRPGWHENDTWCIALGDVDGDGYLDLVCGNDNQPNTLYLGSPVTYFGQDPIWFSSDASPTHDLLLTDADGDGDLDLLCGNHGAATALYRNENGRLSEDPVWYSDDAAPTTSLAGGDIDGDGDFDLVVGNQGVLHGIHYGLRNPAYLGDPTNPTHHLPDNPAYLSRVEVSQPATNVYRYSLTAIDIESDPLWLRAEYRYSDSPDWQVIESLRLVGPLAASPAGVTHQLDWDVSHLLIDPPADRPVTVRLIAIPISQHVVLPQSPTAFQVDFRALDIRRAEIASASVLEFPGVTVGDTVQAPLVITNPGNETLDVTEMLFPGSWLWLEEALPFSVPAGVSHTCTISLAPWDTTQANGEFTINSNAALTPEIQIAVQTDIRALTANTTPLLESDTARLGEALTIHVLPGNEVNLERCALNYRAVNSRENFTDIEMTLSEGFFIGIVPGPDVTEAGLEYYIELENSEVFATDPPDTAGGQYFTQAVAAPALITTQPLPTSGTDFLEGREIAIQVLLDQGVAYEQGILNYRRGGESQYTSIPIPDIEPLPAATIPDSLVGPRGVEYWIQVQTSTSTLTDPPIDPTGSPHTIRVRVTDLIESNTHVGFQYRMVSVPLDFGVDFTGTLESLLSDQAAFGPYPAEPYEQGQWRCFRGFPPDGNYLELPAGSPEDFRVQPDRGFWLISRDENWIATSPVAGTSTPTDEIFNITLEPGWNMIGHPFVFAVAWDSVRVDGLSVSEAEANGDIGGLVAWAGDHYDQEVAVLQPFAGYWIHNNTDPEQDLNLSIPPRESPPAVFAAKSTGSGSSEDVQWQVTITASCAGMQDRANQLGVIAGASDTWDRHDRREPPPAPERSLALYFPHTKWQSRPGHYTVDFRPRAASVVEGYSWRFDVTKDFTVEGAGDRVQLEFPDLGCIPENLQILLVDRALLQKVDLKMQATYGFYLEQAGFVADEGSARFELLVGTADYLAEHTDDLPDQPARTVLYQNRPNPFNPVTVIRYDIAQAGQVSLNVYDVTGTLVASLRSEHQMPGRYEIVWQGEDDHGRRVASGVYFYRLVTSTGYQETRKLLLMK